MSPPSPHHPLTVFFIVYVLTHIGASRAEIVASFGNPFVAIVMALAIIALLWHMKLGMQVIIEDYIHTPLPKSRRCCSTPSSR